MTVFGAFGDGKEVNGQLLRLAMMALLNSNAGSLSCDGGVRMNGQHPDALQVIAGVSGLTIIVKPGLCVVPGTETTGQGPYFVASDANLTVTLNTADGSQGRYDRIVAVVDDNGDNTTSYTITKVTGTPAGSPALPAVPANSLKLGYVLIPALADDPTDLTITDERKQLGAYARTFINIPFVPAPDFSQPEHVTTSSTFKACEMARVLTQQGQLFIEVLVRSDADTSGEVRINVGGTIMGATRTVVNDTYSTFTFGPTVLPGWGTTLGYSSIVEIYVECRRTGGTGTVGARVLNAQLRPI